MSDKGDKSARFQMPKDGLVMQGILKDMGIEDYEPRVINQMLEFTYRYVTNILEDARIYSSHAKKKNIDLDDVKLAAQIQLDRQFTTPPPRELLMDVARTRNANPLPTCKPHCGIRLPHERYCLSAVNYQVKGLHKKSRASKSGGGSSGKNKVSVNVSAKPNTVQAKMSVNPTVQILQPSHQAPTPLIKLAGQSTLGVDPGMVIKSEPMGDGEPAGGGFPGMQMMNPGAAMEPKMEPDVFTNSYSAFKRKRDDDDDYDT